MQKKDFGLHGTVRRASQSLIIKIPVVDIRGITVEEGVLIFQREINTISVCYIYTCNLKKCHKILENVAFRKYHEFLCYKNLD